MDQTEFLIQHLTEGKSYQQIADKYKIHREQLSFWWDNVEGKKIREEINRANQLYNSRVGKKEFAEFEKLGKRKFYEWYSMQPKRCAYCGIEEYKLKMLFDEAHGILKTKRGRGKNLELERRDSEKNNYSPKNCVLACYICNNHKSDLISEADHLKYFAPAIRNYLESKLQEMKNK